MAEALAEAPYGRLTATVQKFEGKLPKSDPLGKPDPYVELCFGSGEKKQRAKTGFIEGREIRGSMNEPVVLEWNEDLALALPYGRTTLHVHLCDDDTEAGSKDDDVVASGYIDLAPLVASWAKQPLPEISQSRKDDGASLQEAKEGTTVVELTTTDIVHRGSKIKGGEVITLTLVLKVEDVPLEPTPPSAPKNYSGATLGLMYGEKRHTVRYCRASPPWLLEKTVRNACGISFGAAVRIVEPANGAEYMLDPRRLPDGKLLQVEVVSPPKRIQLSSKSSAMWFPTLSGLHSARSTASLWSARSTASTASIASDTGALTDRAHYRGNLAQRMASIPMPMPPPDAPLSARSFSSTTAPEGQYKICLLGDSGVGKTTFMARMAMADTPREYRFDGKAEYEPTTATAISTTTVTTTNGPIQIKFWELSGKCTTNISARRKAKNAGDSSIYLAGCDAAIIFFSYKQPAAAYRNVLRWKNLIRRNCGAIPLLVVGLGSDDKKSVAARAEAQEPHAGILAASNKSGDSIFTPILTILAELENDPELRLKAREHKKVVPVTPATDIELMRHVSTSWAAEDADAAAAAVQAEE
jgi:GTPase SAR1 family protein